MTETDSIPKPLTLPCWTLFLSSITAADSTNKTALLIGSGAALIIIATRLRARDLNLAGVVLLAAALAALAWYLGLLSPDLLERAAVSGLTLGGFLLSLQFLAPAVERSDLVQKVGRIFVRQPAGLRYYAISIGVNLMGLLLSISVIPLFLTMVRRTLDEDRTPIPEGARTIIQRRSASAIQRGVSMVPLWSPVSLVIVLLSGLIPDIAWLDYLPFGVALSVTLILIGRWVDRLQNPGTPKLAGFSTRVEPGPIITLLAILALVPILARTASWALEGPPLLGLLLAFPIFGILFFGLQSVMLGKSPLSGREIRGFGEILHQKYHDVGRETGIFVTIGVISALAIPIFRHLQVGELLASIPAPPELILFVCIILSLGISVLGISPLIFATLIVDIFMETPQLELSRAILILSAAFLVGHSWLVSPVSYGAMSVSRELNVSLREILIRWNLPYVICATAAYGLLAAILAWVLP